jgi:hypothetical protein
VSCAREKKKGDVERREGEREIRSSRKRRMPPVYIHSR